jgi:type III secretion protein T
MNNSTEPSLFLILATYHPVIEELMLTIALCSARVLALFTVLPVLSEQFVQGTIRNGILLLISAYVAFGQPDHIVLGMSATQWVGHVAKEAMIGLVMGFAGATVFWTAECVGAMIDTQAGYNSVQLSNPLSGEQSTPVSNLMLQLVVSVFYILGGMLILIGALFGSFYLWPVMSTLPDASRVSEVFISGQVQMLMVGVVKFAAPVLLILMLIDLGIGLITRAADKLEPSSLSQPIKGAVTMLMLALLMGTMINQVKHLLLPTGILKQMKSSLPTEGQVPSGTEKGAGGGGGH